MNIFRTQIFRSLWYDRWINFAVMLGVVCATAVLTGALLVGDSMRGSLKDLTLKRLDRIDTILLGSSFFSTPKGNFEPEPNDLWEDSKPVILFPAAVESNEKVCGVQILGINSWEDNKFSVNQILAERLGIQSGDAISLRMSSPQSIPPESSLGRRDQLIRTRLTVSNVIPNQGIGRFSMRANQQPEPLIIVPLTWLQQKLDAGGKVNAVFFLTDSPHKVSTAEQRTKLEKRFKPTLDDLGIVTEIKNGQNYIKSSRMLFTKPQADAIQSIIPNAKPGLLYLTTSIRATKSNNETPYSTIYATKNNLASHEIALNRWTADDLEVEIGDEIELTWFEPDNVNVTKTQKFTLTEILPMEGLGADSNLVPEVKGFTDEISIADWNPPFPFDAKRIRKKDEDYWDKYHAAPKAFVSLETGQKLFASRFGNTTTFTASAASAALNPNTNSAGEFCNAASELDYHLFGFNFVPIKEQGLAASSGTTPFSVLFLSFSFFIIASALMLVMMLFRLSVEMKAKQIGIRLAVGWTPFGVTKIFLAEGFVLSMIGAFFGTLFGIFYARMMIYGLTTWWIDAVTVPFLTLHITPQSFMIGFVASVLMSFLTITFSLRHLRRIPLRSLLAGEFLKSIPYKKKAKTIQINFVKWIEYAILLQFIVIILFFLDFHPEVFFIGSVIFLFFILLHIYFRLRQCNIFLIQSLFGQARSNIERKPNQSILCIGIVAIPTFLVLSIGAFHLTPNDNVDGFDYIAETAFPVYADIATPEGREQLGIQSEEESFFESKIQNRFEIFSLRMKGGDTASCLNLYQTNSPRILGVTKKIIESRKRFQVSWNALQKPITIDSDGVRRVPIILDKNTAMYTFHLYGGIGDVYELDDGQGKKIRCEIVELLDNSVLQGEMLMSEENLLELFPDVGGYRYFLFRVDSKYDCALCRFAFFPLDDRTVKILYELLGDYGFQGEPTSNRLRKLFAVQNTYLSTFQSLGGIGLLLGVFGLAVIQFRNVFERRKELALFQAIGFTPSRVILMLLYENLTLLFYGLGLAVFASLFALLPFFLGFASQTTSLTSIAVQFVWLVGGMMLIGIVSNIAASFAVLKIPVARELAEER
jgi:ABC-type antimicrobial peptide transport system permease subunit